MHLARLEDGRGKTEIEAPSTVLACPLGYVAVEVFVAPVHEVADISLLLRADEIIE